MYSVSASDKVGVEMFANQFTSRLLRFHIVLAPDLFIEELRALCADFTLLLKDEVKETRHTHKEPIEDLEGPFSCSCAMTSHKEQKCSPTTVVIVTKAEIQARALQRRESGLCESA